MIPPDLEAQILRLHHAEKWPFGTIARQLHVHHSTVRRVLAQAGIAAGRTTIKKSMVDPYIDFIVATLEKWPTLCASRLYLMVRERGYPGRPDHFRSIVSRFRPRRRAEAYLRLRTLPGEQAQVDWAHFGKLRIGHAERPLMCFVMVLSHSRMLFVRFYLNARMESFLRGHLDAFAFFGGVPRVLLYDNLKSAVLERVGDAIRFNPRLNELAAHYHFEPRPVAPARGNEKGRVERAIRYLRDAFFAGRTFVDLADLNAQAVAFMEGPAADRRCPEDRTQSVREAFASERASLMPLPEVAFPAEERVEVDVGKTPYVRFDSNDYSVPHTLVRRTLVVYASSESVRVIDGAEVVAVHDRSWDKGRQFEDPAHINALVDEKRAARRHRGMDRLAQAAPRSPEFLARVAERGSNLGSVVSRLLRLLDLHSAAELDECLAEVLARGLAHVGAVRQELERRRHARGQLPPIPVELPDDPRLRTLVVKPHSLAAYDVLREPKPKEIDHDDDE